MPCVHQLAAADGDARLAPTRGDTPSEVERGVGALAWVLLADAPVDAVAEQVGVPVVAGVLLDHVHEQLAQ